MIKLQKCQFKPGNLGFTVVDWLPSEIRNVEKGSQFYKAGVRAGWKIIRVNNEPFVGLQELKRISNHYHYTLTFEHSRVSNNTFMTFCFDI